MTTKARIPKITTELIATLNMDHTIYPRDHFDTVNVGYMVDALNAGNTLPPIVVCRSTRKVIDGFHRIEATKKYAGATATIKVEWRDYATDAERFADAIQLNARHGFRLTRRDQALCIIKAQALGLTMSTISAALSITQHKADALIVQRLANDSHAQPYALKRTMQHYAGQTLTAEEEDYNKHAGGLNQLFYVNQVIMMLESGTEDSNNENLTAGLEKLSDLLKQMFP